MNPTLLRSRRPGPAARYGLGLTLALAVSLTAGCSGSDDDPDASSSPTTPAAGPTDSPFSVELTGPDTAEPGDTVEATVTNTGRLPDVYQLSMSPQGAASFDQQDFHLSPDESTTIEITVEQVPVRIVLKSTGGGVGEEVAELDIS